MKFTRIFSSRKVQSRLVVPITLAAVMLPLSSSEAQTVEGETAAAPFVLNNSKSFTLKAKSNGRDYQIFVSAPQGEVPAQGYPVIYTSDGNAMFPQMVATANLLRQNSRAVVVGIGYPGDAQFDVNRRYFDLTPKTAPEVVAASGRGGADRETGGNDLFLEFINTELKPVIERQYKIDAKQQTLFGHSLGGLFVLHTLFSKPDSFQNYVAAAPSIWWNDQSILTEEKAFLEKQKGQTSNAKVLILGNTDPTRQAPTPDAGAAARPANPRMAGGEKMGTITEDLKALPGVTADYRVFENESHISMVPPSISAALRFVLGDGGRPNGAGGDGRGPQR